MNSGIRLSPEEVVRAVGYEERVSPVQVITPSPDGWLWVSRSLDGLAPIPVDLFDPDGRYRGTLQSPSIPVAFLSASRFVGLAVKEDTDELILSLFELQETGEHGAEIASDPVPVVNALDPSSDPSSTACGQR